jgi:hypothetical protein
MSHLERRLQAVKRQLALLQKTDRRYNDLLLEKQEIEAKLRKIYL